MSINRKVLCTLMLAMMATKILAKAEYNCTQALRVDSPKDEECCKMVSLDDKESFEKCRDQTRTKYPKAKGLLKDCFIEECIFSYHSGNDTKAMIEDVKTFLKEKFDSLPDWHPVVDRLVERCMGSASITPEELKKKTDASPYNVKGCNPIFSYYVSCISVGLITDCPTKYYTKSKSCDYIKGHLMACPEQYPPINYQEE